MVPPRRGVGSSWAVANSECQARRKDAFLTSIENQNENDFIYSRFQYTFELRTLIFFYQTMESTIKTFKRRFKFIHK